MARLHLGLGWEQGENILEGLVTNERRTSQETHGALGQGIHVRVQVRGNFKPKYSEVEASSPRWHAKDFPICNPPYTLLDPFISQQT